LKIIDREKNGKPKLPLYPGFESVGIVVASNSKTIKPGMNVFCSGAGLFSEYKLEIDRRCMKGKKK